MTTAPFSQEGEGPAGKLAKTLRARSHEHKLTGRRWRRKQVTITVEQIVAPVTFTSPIEPDSLLEEIRRCATGQMRLRNRAAESCGLMPVRT